MRKIVLLAGAVALAGGGVALSAATAQSKKPAAKRKAPISSSTIGFGESGGAVGCYGGCDRTEEKPVRQPVAGPGWYGRSDSVAVDDNMGRGLTLAVSCVGQRPMLSINSTKLMVGDFGDAEFARVTAAERARIVSGNSSVTVGVIDQNDQPTRINLRPVPSPDAVAFTHMLSRATLEQIKRSRSITASSTRWNTGFSGKDAARELAVLPC